MWFASFLSVRKYSLNFRKLVSKISYCGLGLRLFHTILAKSRFQRSKATLVCTLSAAVVSMLALTWLALSSSLSDSEVLLLRSTCPNVAEVLGKRTSPPPTAFGGKRKLLNVNVIFNLLLKVINPLVLIKKEGL